MMPLPHGISLRKERTPPQRLLSSSLGKHVDSIRISTRGRNWMKLETVEVLSSLTRVAEGLPPITSAANHVIHISQPLVTHPVT
jgi:hypothetical protein